MEASISPDPGQQQVRENILGMKGWLKFLGILMIISGALQALSLVGIVIAWLPIWLGVILTQAGSRAQEYVSSGDTQALVQFTGKLRTYFVVTGVLTIISLCLAVVGGIIALALGLFAGGLPQLLRQYGVGN